MAEDVQDVSDNDKQESWMNSKWRPMMGWMYMAVCICDFIVFPVLWSIHQALDRGQVNLQWNPLTLQGAGLFHIAMGAVLGIAAYGRTQEKLGGVSNASFATPTSGAPTFGAPAAGYSAPAGNFSSPTASPAPASSFGGGFDNSTPTATPAVAVGFGGKKAPFPQNDPIQ